MPARVLGALVTLAVVACLLPLAPTQGGQVLAQTSVQVGCLLLAWHAVLGRRLVRRLGWSMLVAALTVLAASDLLSSLERLAGHPTGRPAPSNLLAVLGYLLLALAVLRLERARGDGRPLPGAIEAGIFATGLLTPLLVFLVIPTLQRDGLSVAARSVTIGYALADLVAVTVIARLLISGGHHSRSLGWLSAALVASCAGDALAWLADPAQPVPSLSRVLWSLAYVLFAAGVAHPSMVALIRGAPGSVPRQRRVWLMALGQAMPAVALLFVWLFHQPSSLLVIALGGLLVSLLVTVRMGGLLDQISDQSARLSDLARSDELTGLHNRRSWNFELKRAATAAAARRQPLGVALIDLDHFKSYNDSYGHPAGDRLLKAAAHAWRAALGHGELLARYGGEEFAMLLPGTSLEEAVARLDELRALTPGGQSFSAGVALWTGEGEPEQAVANADSALYEAKRQGRGRVLPFRAASPRGETALPYSMRTLVQPIVRVSDLAVIAYEALSRFEPDNDVEDVFTQAHEDGYGDVLESSAILSALRLPERPPEADVFVNVSERAMLSPHFWQSMPPRLDGVVMELQEHRHGLDDAAVSRLLDRFRDRGARICLDDLVASETELERIISLRPDLVKVDRSLVTGCDRRPDHAARIDRLVRFAAAYGIEVCAEGVESVGELVTLRRLGVPLVQGFLLGHPEPHWIEPLEPSTRLASALEPVPAAAGPARFTLRQRVSGRSGP